MSDGPFGKKADDAVEHGFSAAKPQKGTRAMVAGLALAGLLNASSCATAKPSAKPSAIGAVASTVSTRTTTVSKKSTSKPASVTTGKARTRPATARLAVNLIDVRFDAPGAKPRALNETTVDISSPVTRLSMNITNITYRGLVCGFSFRGSPPKGPVTIQMRGASPATSFDSGTLSISWTGLDSDLVKADSGSNNGWSFSSEAHVNRNGPGWVISLGGVTAEAANVVPRNATCELTVAEPLVAANGPVGYWAGFATV